MILRKLKSLSGLGGARRVLLLEAAACLALARLILVIFPFRTVAARLGEVCQPAVAVERIRQFAGAPADDEAARAVGWAVRFMADRVPFKAVCLQQAVAAKMMLRRRGIRSALHFGVASSETGLNAHAWLDTAGAKVTGYPIGNEFTELAAFI